ncbi:MAG: DnaD domain protein [Bacilli bacterium]|nr:DnaD domain protein [Bacilli bacterium]
MDVSLLPADGYIVINKSIITDEDNKILTMLYLPIVNPTAIMLYNTLVNDLDKQGVVSEYFDHAHLLSNLRLSCRELESARNSLEGIGLLKTYLKKDTVNKYIYELYSPVSAHEFFSHPIFNVVLYNNVGKKEYERLLNYFKVPKINKEGYVEVTHKFSEVYKSIPYTSNEMYSDNIRKYNKLKLNINTSFDMNFLIETLPSNIDKKIFTKDLQELIIDLAYLYDIDAVKMQNIVKSCINEKGNVSRDELRKVCRTHYQFDHSGILPSLIDTTQPEYLRKPIGDNSNIAKMIYTFETVSPYDFLKSKHNGAEPVKRDILLLENLLIDYKLKPGVINVLIDYVLKTDDNKLNRSLVETIAGQWSRKKIETVEEAMAIAKKNHKSVSKNIGVKKTKEEKQVPTWFNDTNIKESVASLEEQEEMANFLKEL